MATTFAPAPPPQAAPSGDPTAVFGRRVVAGVLDAVVVGVPGIAISTSALRSFDLSGSGMDGDDFCDRYIEQNDGTACMHVNDTAYFTQEQFEPATLAPLGFAVLMFVVIQGLTGWTVGKLLMGLRTVKSDGSVVGLGRALVRWLMWIVDGFPCFGIVGLITAGTSTGHRRVGDIVAKTFVVRRRDAGAPIVVPGLTTPATTEGGTWNQPQASAWGQTAMTSSTSAPSAAEPQWDAARGTYIQWDAGRAKWLQWDDASRSWTEIPGQ